MSKTLCGEPIKLTDDNGYSFYIHCRDFHDHDGDHYSTISWAVNNA